MAFSMLYGGNVMFKKIAWKILSKEINKILDKMTEKTLENENLKQRIKFLSWEIEKLKWTNRE
uniref:Uncharacterized protein n=1 Tax=Dulem virus 211 TaxID=3145688 RepID=A0AAU8B484_9VIRU